METTRGKGGGMRIARPPQQISIGEVVRAEDKFALVECFQEQDGNCSIATVCQLNDPRQSRGLIG